MTRPTVRGRRGRDLACGAVALTGCGTPNLQPAPDAAARYPAIASEVAEAVGAESAPLTSDGSTPKVGLDSSGCRVTGQTFSSSDLLRAECAQEPDAEQIAAAADPVLAERGFDALEAVDDEPLPMTTLAAQDEQGGTIRVVLESRSGRPTIQL